MKRSLVKQGATTMMVSLPANWIQANNLDKGDSVEIQNTDNTLLISTETQLTKSETTITLTGLNWSGISSIISNTYRKGFDIIHVRYENEKQFKIINEVIKNFIIGFDVIKKENNSCTIECITEPAVDQFDSILKKMFFNFSEYLHVTSKRMSGENEEFTEINNRIQRYGNFCIRAISKKKYIVKHSEYYWTFIYLMLTANTEMHHLNSCINEKTSKDTTEYLKKIVKMLDSLKEAYFNKDVKLLARVHDFHGVLIYTEGYNLLKKVKPCEMPLVYHMMAFVRRIYQANSPLMGILI